MTAEGMLKDILTKKKNKENTTKLEKQFKQRPSYYPICKVGDTVYFPDETMDYVFDIKISEIIISQVDDKIIFQYNGAFFNAMGDLEQTFEFDDNDFIKKTVYLNEQDANAALQKLKNKNTTEDTIIELRQLWYDIYMTYINPDPIAAAVAYNKKVNHQDQTVELMTKAIKQMIQEFPADIQKDIINTKFSESKYLTNITESET